MDILQVFQKFPDQTSCISFLEKKRWGDTPECPYCQSQKISKHASKDRAIGRWQCQVCQKAFSVTVGTIFHRTHLPMQKWFLALSIVLNAKKGMANRQLGRHLDLPSNTAWRLAKKIREGFVGAQKALLQGILEMDETYVGGKSKESSKRGRGTDKMPVLGIVERGGSVVAKKAEGKVNSDTLMQFIKEHINPSESRLFTDQYPGYSGACAIVEHATVNHSQMFVTSDGVHTNTIEGFWALLKRAWYGQPHHYSREYANLYFAEAADKYNHRKNSNIFFDAIDRMLER